MLKKVAFLLSTGYTLVLTSVSLMSIKDIPDLGFSFSDKVFHFFAYSVLCFLWFIACLYTFRFAKKQSIFYALIFSVIFGMFIEVLQGAITVSRAFDVYDMLANSLGALLASTILWFNTKRI